MLSVAQIYSRWEWGEIAALDYRDIAGDVDNSVDGLAGWAQN